MSPHARLRLHSFTASMFRRRTRVRLVDWLNLFRSPFARAAPRGFSLVPSKRPMLMLNEKWTLLEPVETVTGRTFSRTRGRFARFVKRLSAVIGVGLLLSGCEGRSSSPTAPGPPTRPLTYTLSGVVTELTLVGMAPVEGARVEEARSRRFAVTDTNGFYSLSRLSAANTSISVNKPGYVSNTRTVTISGDTQLDLRVDPS